MRTSKGMAGIEFVVAVAIFLSAFWFIYLQGAFMLTSQTHRSDLRELAVEHYSNILISDSGYPQDWANNPSRIGLAEYKNEAINTNVLDKGKLDWIDGEDCLTVQEGVMTSMEFAFSVTTNSQQWACNTNIAKNGVIQRPVYVHSSNGYEAGVLEVWAA